RVRVLREMMRGRQCPLRRVDHAAELRMVQVAGDAEVVVLVETLDEGHRRGGHEQGEGAETEQPGETVTGHLGGRMVERKGLERPASGLPVTSRGLSTGRVTLGNEPAMRCRDVSFLGRREGTDSLQVPSLFRRDEYRSSHWPRDGSHPSGGVP